MVVRLKQKARIRGDDVVRNEGLCASKRKEESELGCEVQGPNKKNEKKGCLKNARVNGWMKI